MFRILIVDNSQDYQRILSRTLGEYQLTFAENATEASQWLASIPFDLILLDLNLPHRRGFSLLSEIQSDADFRNIPILCLSERKEITEKVTAFSLGADDYITKPFEPLEVRARVEARLKKNAQKKSDRLFTRVGDIEIDHARHRVTVCRGSQREEIAITQTEFKLLCCLARRPDQVYTRDQLLVAAWGEDASVLDRVVDAHICLLRKKLGSYSRYIKAVPGVGYKIVPVPFLENEL